MITRSELVQAQCILSVGRTFALVDPEDYEVLRKRDWKLKRSASGKLYAFTRIKNEAGLQTWYLHHAVATRAHGPRVDLEQCCHAENGDYLDCRRANLQWRDKKVIRLQAMLAGRARQRANA